MNKFSIDYPEYHIAGMLQDVFKKGDDFSINIPMSRQQKNYDLLLFNGKNKKCVTIQVKSARTYIDPGQVKGFNFYAWFNNFKIENNYSDFFFLFITYPVFDLNTFKPKSAYGTRVLVFNNSEMKTFLSSINNTKKGEADRFFALGFNIDFDGVFGERGFSRQPRRDFSEFLYEKKLIEVRNAIE